MTALLKKFLYFPFAYYFFVFAKIQLFIWKPKVICITGSSGKTTLLHLVQSQLKDAHFSHHANSAFGIPFDILNIKRSSYSLFEWPVLFLLAPFKAFRKPYRQRFYVVEADCDRPHEGFFLSKLLEPHITLWVSSDLTHTQNFASYRNSAIADSVAYEFGHFLENTKKNILVNGDSPYIHTQLKRATAKVEMVNMDFLTKFEVKESSVSFVTKETTYNIPCLIPRGSFYSIIMVVQLLEMLNKPFDPKFTDFKLPPGRSSLFKGVKGIKIIDSSYNSSFISLKNMLELLEMYPAGKKWAVIGDLLELGEEEKEEHEKIADLLNPDFEKIILIGPRTQKYTYPRLMRSFDTKKIETFLSPKEALLYIQQTITGEEVILFKGARFLEGIIEHLLINKEDIEKLCRREKVWQKRREEWEL